MANNRKIIAIACIVIAVIIVVAAGAILFLNKTPSGTTVTPTPGTTQNTNFKGIYVFNGNNASTFDNNPSIAGTYLGYYWSQLEPQQGQYNWSQIDNDMQPWVANGKNVILRVSTSGQYKWQPPNSGNGTPQWVYSQGVSSVTETDHSVIPQYWSPAFLSNLNTFVQAFASRYDGNAHVTAIEIGVGMGGETKPDTLNNGKSRMQQWQAIGYTDAVWWNTVQQIASMYTSAFHKTPVALLPDATFIGNDKSYTESMVLNYAVSHNIWLQDDGLGTSSKPLPSQWKKVPVISEQRADTDTSGDTLEQDVQLAMQHNSVIIMIFAQDLSKNDNQSVLQQTAALIKH